MLENYYSGDGPNVTDALTGNTFEHVVDFKGLYTVFRFDYVKNVEEDPEDISNDYTSKKMLASRALVKSISDFDAMLHTALGLIRPTFDVTEIHVPRERGGRSRRGAILPEETGDPTATVTPASGTNDGVVKPPTRKVCLYCSALPCVWCVW